MEGAVPAPRTEGGRFAPPGDICQCLETLLVVTTLVGGGHVSNWYLVDRGQGAAKHATVHRQPHQTGLSGQVSVVLGLRNPAFDHYFCLFTYFLKFLARLRGMRDLSSPTRGRACAPCIGSAES